MHGILNWICQGKWKTTVGPLKINPDNSIPLKRNPHHLTHAFSCTSNNSSSSTVVIFTPSPTGSAQHNKTNPCSKTSSDNIAFACSTSPVTFFAGHIMQTPILQSCRKSIPASKPASRMVSPSCTSTV